MSTCLGCLLGPAVWGEQATSWAREQVASGQEEGKYWQNKRIELENLLRPRGEAATGWASENSEKENMNRLSIVNNFLFFMLFYCCQHLRMWKKLIHSSSSYCLQTYEENVGTELFVRWTNKIGIIDAWGRNHLHFLPHKYVTEKWRNDVCLLTADDNTSKESKIRGKNQSWKALKPQMKVS